MGRQYGESRTAGVSKNVKNRPKERLRSQQSAEDAYKDTAETIYLLVLDVSSLEHNLEAGCERGVGNWVKAIKDGSFSDATRQSAAREITLLNKKADSIVQKSLEAINSVTKANHAMKEDIRSRDGDIIRNGRLLSQQERPLPMGNEKNTGFWTLWLISSASSLSTEA